MRAATILFFIALLTPGIAYAQGGPFECKTPASPDKPPVSFTGPFSLDPKLSYISGNVVINCDGTRIEADRIEWTDKTVVATGDVLIAQDGLRVNAERAELDRVTKMGVFYQAVGTARLSNGEAVQSMFGSLEPEVMFVAEKLERIGPRTYRLTNGMFSTCVQANPRWVMTGSSGTVVLDEHAVMKNLTLKVKSVPVMYLPYMYVPLKRDTRKTGFLIPQYSTGGVRGWGFSNGFFLTLGDSQDATFYYDWFSKGYQGGGGEYRYVASPTSNGRIQYYMSDEENRLASDGTIERAGRQSYDVRGDISQALPRGFRLNGRVNYMSDITTQQLYQQNIYEQSRRDRNLVLQVNGNLTRRLRIAATTEQQDYFVGGTVARKGALPRVELWLAGSGLRPSGPLQKVYFSARGETAYRDVRPNLALPEFDRNLWRFDGQGDVNVPLSNYPWLTVNGRAYWRVTNWQETLDPLTGSPVDVPLTRNLFNLHADISGPKLEREFATPNLKYSQKFRHTMEPWVSVDYLSPFNQRNQVIQLDPMIDQLVGGTTQIAYAYINRLYAKIGDDPSPREILSVTLSQSWYSNAQAGAIDPNYPVASINTYSPINFRVVSSPVDDIRADFQVYVDSTTRRVQSYSARGFLRPQNGERLEISGGWSLRPIIGNFTTPGIASHFIDASTTFRLMNGKIEGMYSLNYDIKNNGLVQQRMRGFYGAQCCGIAIDYQMMNVSQYQLQGTPRDRRLAVTFTLAGLGAFTAPLGAFGR